MQTHFTLGKDDIEKAKEFALTIRQKNAQSPSDFGEHELRRKDVDFGADTIEGKLSEIIFAKFIQHNAGYEIEPDFDIYDDPLLIDYGQDIDLVKAGGKSYRCRSRVDVKATRNYSQWLLVESHKFWADAYVLVKMDLPRDFEKDISSLDRGSVSGEVSGFAYHFDIIDPAGKKPWFRFNKGDQLFNPNILSNIPKGVMRNPDQIARWLDDASTLKKIGYPLKAKTNYGIPVSWLRKNKEEWDLLFRWIKGSSLTFGNELVLNILKA
jgi:hypothetical protein